MKNRTHFLALFSVAFLILTNNATAQTTGEEKKYQAKAPKTQPFGMEAFEKSGKTVLRWLGMGGFFINSRGTTP